MPRWIRLFIWSAAGSELWEIRKPGRYAMGLKKCPRGAPILREAWGVLSLTSVAFLSANAVGRAVSALAERLARSAAGKRYGEGS